MKAKFNFNEVEISMSAKYLDCVYNVWNDNQWHNKYYVTITTANGKTAFYFYGCAADCENGKIELNANDLKGCLDCFLSDASCYESAADFDDFCNEFGYTSMKDYKRALSAFNGCKRHYNAALRVFGSDYYKIIDEINESY